MDASVQCDRCGAQAYTRWWHPTAGRLTLCSHHTTQHERSLRDAKWLLEVDDRHQLLAQPSPRLGR